MVSGRCLVSGVGAVLGEWCRGGDGTAVSRGQ